MNIIQKFRSLDRVSKCAVILFGSVATIYGGSKHTNNVPPLLGAPAPYRACLTPGSVTAESPTTIAEWTATGVWNDWRTIDFPEPFKFPYGTNYITSVTLMSNGALKTSLRPQPTTNNQQPTTTLAALPQAVSLEPDVSSVSYGLTSSNTFVFAWQNVCVNRDATNRTDATIELCPNGSIVTTFGNAVGRVAPRPPQGFIGSGQDLAWATNAFPFAASNICEKGYLGWLDDYIGHDEPNGRYQVKVTVASLPSDGSPCYLFVGPYKTIVTTPGVYAFPLEVFDEYWAYTAPARVPLTFEYDDGYEYDTEPEPLFLAPPMTMAGMTPREELEYRIQQIPRLEVRPNVVYRGEQTLLSLKCNMANAVRSYWSAFADDFRLTYCSQTEAEILEASVVCTAWLILENEKGRCEASVVVVDRPVPDPPSTNICHCASCTNGCPCAAATTNGWNCASCTNGCPCIIIKQR